MSPIQNLRKSLAYVLIFSLYLTGLLTFTTRQSQASNNSLTHSSTPSVKESVEKNGPQPKTVNEATRARVSEAYNKLPLSFEENRGQVNKEVKYLSRGSGYTLFLTETEAVLALRQNDGRETAAANDASPSPVSTESHPTLMSVLRMKLGGANRSPVVRGESEMGAKTNYFKGNDPQKWQTGIARYEQVRYEQVYPGVDMICSGQQQRLGYDFEVVPGADARRIKLEFTGVKHVEIERETGDLLLKIAGVEMRQHRPVAYQEMGGERREVASRYVLKGKRKVRIEVGEYERTQRLVIGLALSRSTHPSAFKADNLFTKTSGNAAQPGKASVNTATAQERSSGATTQEQQADSQVTVNRHPQEVRIVRAHSFDGDLRDLPYIKPVKKERPELEPPETIPVNLVRPIKPASEGSASNESRRSVPVPAVPAPTPLASFDGLDYDNWSTRYPPDANGDVSTDYYVQAVNTSIGIYNKNTGARYAAFTFDTFMSLGNFGNPCDTDNRGDPVVLYDTFADRWIITDLAFRLDGSNIINPPGAFQCIAVSKTGDPLWGGWNYYSINTEGGLGDYPKFGIWPDGLYMSVNMFDYNLASDHFQNVRVYAINKARMYAGESLQGVAFNVLPMDNQPKDFTILPANARLQTGAPPAGSPNYMAVVWKYPNAISVYKFHVDWNNLSNSTLSEPSHSLTDTSWSLMSSATVPGGSGANSLDTVPRRLMMQNQYTNIGGVESLWNSHTVGATATQAAVRYYQVKVTGGTVEANATQAATWSPDATNRYIPSVAVDSAGNMAIGYTTSSDSLYPGIKYAGRLSTDPANTLSLTEQTLFQGTGGQTAECLGSPCHRWGDYSAMSLAPDGCTFWYTNEYYDAASGDNWHTRIGSFKLPQCTTNDPTNYSTYLGGSGSDGGGGIAVDASGYAYVTGYTESLDFPVRDAFQTSYAGDLSDAFVTKLDTNASGAASLVFSTYLGGSSWDYGSGIAVDAASIVYVTGHTSSFDFPLSDPSQPYCGGVFVTKLDTNASGAASLLFSTCLGGDSSTGIAVDSSGHAYVTGFTWSDNFPVRNQFQTCQSPNDYYHAFVTKLDTNAPIAASLLYSTCLVGSHQESAEGIAVDDSGHAYVTGYTTSPDFPVRDAFQPSYMGGLFDAFVTELDTNASGAASLVFSTYLGGSSSDLGSGIAVDSSGYAYVTGTTNSPDFPVRDQFQTYQGPTDILDAFVTKLDTNVSGAASLLYSTYLGGSSHEFPEDIAVDDSGHAYVTGHTPSPDFPVRNQFQTYYAGGFSDAFVSKVDTNASGAASLPFSTYLGGTTGYEFAYGIAVDPSGIAYVTGNTTSIDFPTINQYQGDQGGSDVFVTKLAKSAVVRGRVTSDGINGISSVTITVNGTMPNTTVTDGDGNYFINLAAGGNYTVAPSTGGLTFVPSSLSFTNLQADQTDVNFMANQLAISGRITSDGTNGLSDVTVTLSGSQSGTFVTDSTGNYAFNGLPVGGNYTITPTKSGLVFDPPERTFTNLQANQTNVNFTGGLATVSGRVTSDGTNGISGVNVYLTGSQSGTVITDSTGSYSFTNLAGGGNYTVTPSKSDLIFTPPERSFTNLQANQTGVNFTTQPATISGRVTTDTGAALTDVTITLTNAALTLTTTTANDGTYSFSNLPIPANYKVKPSKTGYTFSPSDIALYNLSTNQPDVNFVGSTNYQPQTSTISGRVTRETVTGAVLGGVTVTLTRGPDFTLTTTTASDGTYSFSNLPTRDTYTLTLSRNNYTFSPSQIALNNLKTTQANTNFVAKLKTYTISGVVKFGSNVFSDVTMVLTSLTPAGFAPRTATTDSTGAYSLTNIPAERDYTVTPTLSGYQFTPVNKSFTNLSGNQAAVNFAVLFHSITGRITRTGTTTGIPSVTVTITSPVPANFEARTTQTGPLGNYQFTVLPAGRDYIIEPSKAGFTFTPTTRSITNLSNNIPAGASTNFTGTGP